MAHEAAGSALVNACHGSIADLDHEVRYHGSSVRFAPGNPSLRAATWPLRAWIRARVHAASLPWAVPSFKVSVPLFLTPKCPPFSLLRAATSRCGSSRIGAVPRRDHCHCPATDGPRYHVATLDMSIGVTIYMLAASSGCTKDQSTDDPPRQPSKISRGSARTAR